METRSIRANLSREHFKISPDHKLVPCPFGEVLVPQGCCYPALNLYSNDAAADKYHRLRISTSSLLDRVYSCYICTSGFADPRVFGLFSASFFEPLFLLCFWPRSWCRSWRRKQRRRRSFRRSRRRQRKDLASFSRRGTHSPTSVACFAKRFVYIRSIFWTCVCGQPAGRSSCRSMPPPP